MEKIISSSIIFAISLMVLTGCASPQQPETMQQPEASQSKKMQSPILAGYIRSIMNKVKSNWQKAESPHGTSKKLTVTSFKLYPDGKIEKPQIRKSSGYKNLDNLTVDAINASVPFPPMPPELKKSSITVSIDFNYKYGM